MKIILLLLFFSFIALISYIYTNNKEVNYTILGDKELFSNNLKSINFADLISRKLEEEKLLGFYSKDFIKKDIRTIDVINDINDNYKVDNITIQNILKRTDLLLLSIGNNEIYYKLSKIDYTLNNDNEIYNYLNSVVKDINNLIQNIENINKCDIIFLGFYNDTNNVNNDKYYIYINKKLEKTLSKRNIEYINLYKILNTKQDNLTKTSPIYITNEGNIEIYDEIIRKIDKFDLHNKS